MRPRASIPIFLVGLTFLFFWPLVLHPEKVLYSDHSDALAQHIPYKRFLARSWKETGEIPLWCPHSLGGAPFISDPQVSIFYPPNLLLLPIPDRLIGAAFSWLVVLHVLAGGLFAYAYAREEGLQFAGAFITGVGYMLSGKWLLLMLTGGQTVVIGLAWLPLILLCFERAVRRRSVGWTLAAGVVLALLVLGTHPQWTLYAGILIVLWTMNVAWEDCFGRRAILAGLSRWAGLGLLMAITAAALAAIQLLPTLEALQYTARYVLQQADPTQTPTDLRTIFDYKAWLGLIGPSLTSHPDWETVAGVGVLWAMAATAGVYFGGRMARHRAGICAFLFIFALGGGYMFHALPLLDVFRCPLRMLLLTSLPIALLAGYATDWFATRMADVLGLQRCLILLASVAVVAVVYTELRIWLIPDQKRYIHFYWPTLALSVPCILWLTRPSANALGRARLPLWCALLVVDLLAMSWPAVEVHRQGRIYAETPALKFLASRRDDRFRVLDVYDGYFLSPLGCGAPAAVNLGLYPIRGFNALDYFRYKSYLRMVSDSDLPTTPSEVVDGFAIAHRSLLDLLGVRYLLAPRDDLPPGPNWHVAFEDHVRRLAYHYNYPHHGMEFLSPYTVYENETVMLRAFVVPTATPMPAGREKEALLATDFHKTVLVEQCDPSRYPAGSEGSFHTACIVEYQPNTVKIEVNGDAPGWLVLTDMWFPGWSCKIEGEAVSISQGNYLFRTVPVPAGRHEVVFRFLPERFILGLRISLGTLAGVAGAALFFTLRRMRSKTVAVKPISENQIAAQAA